MSRLSSSLALLAGLGLAGVAAQDTGTASSTRYASSYGSSPSSWSSSSSPTAGAWSSSSSASWAAATTSMDYGSSSSSDSDSDVSPWVGVGSASFYWHNRYHGLLAMAAYGDYRTLCPQTFTAASLQAQYPGNTNEPFEVVGEWGPTEKYKSEGFMVRVPEMNKILMVFKGQYGWQQYPADLVPFEGIGCDSRCMVHRGAYEAWQEVRNATDDMEVIKERQGDLVWSASGHGFGGMVAQVAALDLKSRGLAYSCHSFGSPAVFNQASVNRWNDLFEGDGSQRTVANEDSVPTAIPVGYNVTSGETSEYAHVNTGIHVFGYSAMYGQDFYVCVDAPTDERCLGGSVEADHYFYYTDIGTCGAAGWSATYNTSYNAGALRSDGRAFNATFSSTLPFNPPTAAPVTTTSSTSSSSLLPNSTISATTASQTSTVNSTAVGGLAANGKSVASTQGTIAESGAGRTQRGALLSLMGAVVLGAVVLMAL